MTPVRPRRAAGAPGRVSAALAAVVAFAGVAGAQTGENQPGEDRPGESGPAEMRFTETAALSGVRFVNMYGGVRTKRFILETTGTGAAFFDYDGDGFLDLFLANGTRLGYGAAESLSSALFRGDGAGRFSEVTGPAGLEAYGWAQGAAIADHENDGDLDLFVTYYGENRFYRNRGDGTFEEAAAEVGLDDPRWGAGAAFGDLDRDGAADLVVVNYVDFDPETTPGPGEAPTCFFLGMPVMCGPKGLEPAPALLYRARPDGRFDRVPDAGVGAERFFGLGVAIGDLDDDGDLDLYTANDQTPNNLYRNDSGPEGLRFTDIGLPAGVAYNEDGRAQAGMGVDLGDYDGDGRLDLTVTNFSHDYNTLYRNAGPDFFLDESFAAGVAEPSWPYLGWGTGFADFDRDGRLDLLAVNGHVYPEVEGGVTESDYAQRILLFRNGGGGRFAEERPEAFGVRRVYRGAAFGDYDEDGDPDLAATVMNGPPALFRNDTEPRGNWVGFRPVGRRSPRDGIGTRIVIEGDDAGRGPAVLLRESRSGSSYLSASDPRVLFGLGEAEGPVRARVRWVSGLEQEIVVEPGAYRLVVEPRR